MNTSLTSGTPRTFCLYALMITAVVMPNIAANAIGPFARPIFGLRKQDETPDPKKSDFDHYLQIARMEPMVEQTQRGELHNSLKQWDKAINEFKQPAASDLLIEQAPSFYVRANVGLAAAWQGKGRSDVALSILHDLAAKGADLTIAHRLRADIYHSQGLLQAELAARYHTLSLKPDEIELQIDLGWMLATSPSPEIRDNELALQVAKGMNGDNASEENSPRVKELLAAIVAADGNFDMAINFQKSALENENIQDREAAEARLAGYRKKIAYVEPDSASACSSLSSKALYEHIRRSVVLIRLEGAASGVDHNGRPVTFQVQREQLAAVLSPTGEFLVSDELVQPPNLPEYYAENSDSDVKKCDWDSSSPLNITAWQFGDSGEPRKLGDVVGRAGASFWNLAVYKLQPQKDIPADGIAELEAIRFTPDLAHVSQSPDRLVWSFPDFRLAEMKFDVKTVQALTLADSANRSSLPAGAILFDDSGRCAAIVPWTQAHALVESQSSDGLRPDIRLACSITRVLAALQGHGEVPRFRLPMMVSPVPVDIPAQDGAEPDFRIGLRVDESDSLPDGLRSGDTIVQIDGNEMESSEDIARILELVAARKKNAVTLTLSDSRKVELIAAMPTELRQ